MSDSGSGNSARMLAAPGATTAGCKPHAFDPYLQPELFRGVLTRRILRS